MQNIKRNIVWYLVDPEDTKHILTTTKVYCINIYENHLMIKMIDKEITGSLMYILRYM